MPISVPPAQPQKFARMARNKKQRIFRFNIPVVGFFKQCFNFLTCSNIVFIQPQMVLFAVENADVNKFFLRTPSNCCQILVAVTIFYVNSLTCFQVINAKPHYFTSHPCHWIFYRVNFRNSLGYIHNRIIGNISFVFAIECNIIPFR